jgi:phospholipase/carboxylesterase
MYKHSKDYIRSGVSIKEAKRAIIMVHGRGANAESIISLSSRLELKDTTVFAPRATHQSWYPYSFLAPAEENQPALDSALELLNGLVQELLEQGLGAEDIYFLGFSQGACLSLEYVSRHGKRYGGVIAFTGGLIGEELVAANYLGDFGGTPFLITTGDPDPHVPVARVEDTVNILRNMNGNVMLKIYPGRPHSILPEELELANQHVLR